MTTEARLIALVCKVCDMNRDSVQRDLGYAADVRIILRRKIDNRAKTRLVFEHVMAQLSYQAIADRIIENYREEHGDITYFQIARRLAAQTRRYGRSCHKLKSFEAYTGCRYQKGKLTCNNRPMLMACPVRRHDLLKGVLNIKAYSFFFYIRDVCQGDLISHFDRIIGRHYRPGQPSWIFKARDALVEDFKRIYGVGDKLSNMGLSFLLSADPRRSRWLRIGQAMVAIDSLVHNFLHRTGILKFYGAEHNYGPGCPIDCFSCVDILSRKIDARQFNQGYPKYFPRFVQLSVWIFCTLSAHNICNGVNIDDSKCCERDDICPLYDLCDHIALKDPGNENE
jgi:hypothetical protein